MATTTSRLQLVIAGDNKGAVKSIDGVDKSIGGLQGKLGGLGAGLAGAFSVGAVVAFGKASVSTYSDIAGSVAGIKRVTGESAEDASLLAFAAQQSGIDAAKAAVGWRTLAKNIDSGKVAAEGIATKDQNGNLLEYGDILGNIADRVQELPPGFQRTALAQKLFGKSGADMVKILAGGRQGIEDMREEMQSYGLEFSDAGLKKYTEFVKAQRDMKASLMGVQVEVAERVVPVLTAANKLFASIPEPVKLGALAVGGLAAGVLGLASAITLFNAVAAPGLVQLGLMSAESATAAGATTALAGAETLAAEAAAAEAAATAALTTALLAGGAAEAEFAAAAAARAAASTAAAEASAAGAAATAGSAGALGSVGTAGLAAAAGLGSYFAASKFLDNAGKSNADVEGLALALGKVGQKGGEASDVAKALGTDVDGLAHAFEHSFDNAGFWERIGPSGDSAVKINQSQDMINKLDQSLADLVKNGHSKEAKEQYGQLLVALHDQGVDVGTVTRGLSGYREAQAKAAAGAYDEAEALAHASEASDDLRTATEKLNDATQEAIDKQSKLTDARESHTNAEADAVRANYELQVAQQEAAGNSDEYRQAEERVTEALAAVPEAERKVTDAQSDLNDARKEAEQRLRDMAQAERDAALAQQDAQLKVKEALNEQRRINADPTSSALDKERAALAVAQARNDASKATSDAAQAAADNAEAQRKGVEGDAEVVRAKQSVADANDGVRDAVKGVRDAEADAANVITEAKGRVLEAQKNATDAAIGEAQAWGDVVTQQYGAVAGAQALRDKYEQIRQDLDPNSPLYQRITQLMHDLTEAISVGLTSQLGSGIPPSRNPDAGLPTTDGAGRSASKSGVNVTTINNNTFLGTPTQTRRAQEQASQRYTDRLAGRLR